MSYRQRGFTLIELLIVLVVIAILVTVSIVSYRGLQERTRGASLEVDLANAAKEMELAYTRYESMTQFPSTVKASAGNVLQLASVSGNTRFCINGYGPNNTMKSYLAGKGIQNHLCSGAGVGSTVGGSLPTPPHGVNLVSDFSNWTLSGGVTYDAGTKEIRLGNTTGTATSPLVRVDGAATCRFQLESYATQPSPTATPQTQVYSGSKYYGSDGVTLVTNTGGYTSNGNAYSHNLNTWVNYTWNTACGPNVKYVQFIIHSNPTGRTSDNRYRNPQISIP